MSAKSLPISLCDFIWPQSPISPISTLDFNVNWPGVASPNEEQTAAAVTTCRERHRWRPQREGERWKKGQTHVIMMPIVQSTLKALTFWCRYWIQVPSGQQQNTFLNLCYIGRSWTQNFHLVKLGRLSLGHSKIGLECVGSVKPQKCS